MEIYGLKIPSSLHRGISPPPARLSRSERSNSKPAVTQTLPSAADLEAGKAELEDHLAYFSNLFRTVSRELQVPSPRLTIDDFVDLYQRNQNQHGKHFVIHQHNHPIAGLHYDLRLQFSKSSSLSFAIPYGLPGNPNSKRQGRLAIETRVHNLWNHLIESASNATGSMLIWDTGEYEILSRQPKNSTTDDETSDEEVRTCGSEPQKLITAFQNHSISLRLRGTRLPPNYTVSLRLPSKNLRTKPPSAKRKRRRKESVRNSSPDSSDSVDDAERRLDAATIASEDEDDAQTRETNAYPGATNSIGSVHQRHWFLMLDKKRSGFAKEGGKWIPLGEEKVARRLPGALRDTADFLKSQHGGFDPFFVRGAEFERSIVTGRLSREIMQDEDVGSFQERKNWNPILI